MEKNKQTIKKVIVKKRRMPFLARLLLKIILGVVVLVTLIFIGLWCFLKISPIDILNFVRYFA